jgi:putative ABC transport system permease protein
MPVTSRFARVLLRAYPAAIRRDHGVEMASAVEASWRDHRTLMGRARLLADLVVDWATSWVRPGRSGGAASGAPEPRRPGGGAWGADVQSAARLFTRNPLLALGAVLTLALGIGATAAIFSLADATLLRPLPIRAPSNVWALDFSWSHPDFRDLETAATPFAEVAAWSNQTFGLDTRSESIEVSGAAISGGYFPLIGVPPAAGRLLENRDDQAGAAPVAVLSERAWVRIFGRDPSLVGSVLLINRRPVTIVGIVPRFFRGLSLADAPDLFLPLEAMPVVGTGLLGRRQALANRGLVWLHVAGRLRPGATVAQATSAVDALYRQRHPPVPGAEPDHVSMAPLARTALGGGSGDDLRRFVWVLLGATAVTLLLSCATVANLLLVRAERRRRELALRAALGASRARLLRLVLVESAAIGLAGGLSGLAVAAGALRLLGAFQLPGRVSIDDLGLALSPTLLALSVGLGLGTSLVFGLAPAWLALRRDPQRALGEGSRGTTLRQPIRSGLVAAQVGLCVLLLLGSVAFGRALRYALSLNLGFDTTTTALVTVNPARARYSRAQMADVDRRILEAVRAEPWVTSAGWMSILPLRGSMSWQVSPISADGHVTTPVDITSNIVSDGYFAAMGIPVREGRPLSALDTATAPPAVVVSEGMARRYWPAGPVVGARVSMAPDSPDPAIATVVGVVGDVRRGIDHTPDLQIYVAFAQHPDMFDFAQHLVVRTRLAPEAALGQVVALVGQVDPALPISTSQTMSEHLGALLMPQRLGLTLLLLFAGLAVVLTTLGIYAVVAFAVAERRREIGIRVALGAERARVLSLVARQGLGPVGLGVGLGLMAFVLAGSTLRALIFALPAMDVGSMLLLAAAIGTIAVGAMLVPARRALAVDPVVALRQD